MSVSIETIQVDNDEDDYNGNNDDKNDDFVDNDDDVDNNDKMMTLLTMMTMTGRRRGQLPQGRPEGDLPLRPHPHRREADRLVT